MRWVGWMGGYMIEKSGIDPIRQVEGGDGMRIRENHRQNREDRNVIRQFVRDAKRINLDSMRHPPMILRHRRERR